MWAGRSARTSPRDVVPTFSHMQGRAGNRSRAARASLEPCRAVLKAQQGLRVAVRKGAQERHEADQGRRPPVGQTAERIALRDPLGMKLDEHGEAFGDREKHGRNMDELYGITS